jgi:hypothetical protein
MRSHADRLRIERVLRVVALATLLGWIVNAIRPRSDHLDVVRGASLAEALPRWTRAQLDSVQVQLDTVPDAAGVAWLAALRGAGVGVSWSGNTIPDVALETYAAVDPAGGVFVLTSAPAAAVLSDALGPVDTLSGNTPARVRVPGVEGEITLTSGVQPARAAAPASHGARRVFVTGAAGWEAKFVIAALEETGWTVDARLFVGPGHEVVQGGGARGGLDTSRHAAVVLLDSTAAEVTRGVEPFARAGGGVVLAGDANRGTRMSGLVAWRARKRETAPLGTLAGDTAWRGLSRAPFDTIAGRRAIPLEIRNGKPIVAARRHYAGRVVAVGYDQTWRWRMAGGDNGPAAHRDWWSRIVASVAARTIIPGQAGDIRTPAGSAPLASLHNVLGPPSATALALSPALPSNLLAHLLGLVCLVALLAEWMLRRARGAR